MTLTHQAKPNITQRQLQTAWLSSYTAHKYASAAGGGSTQCGSRACRLDVSPVKLANQTKFKVGGVVQCVVHVHQLYYLYCVLSGSSLISEVEGSRGLGKSATHHVCRISALCSENINYMRVWMRMLALTMKRY